MSFGARGGRAGEREGGMRGRREERGGVGGSRIYTRNIPDITKCNKAVDTSIKVRRTKISWEERKEEQLPPLLSFFFPEEMNGKTHRWTRQAVFELNKFCCCCKGGAAGAGGGGAAGAVAH